MTESFAIDGFCLAGLMTVLGLVLVFGGRSSQRWWGWWWLAQAGALMLLAAGQHSGRTTGELATVAVLVSGATALIALSRTATTAPQETGSPPIAMGGNLD